MAPVADGSRLLKVGYLDYVLLPALAVFGAIILYALFRQRRASTSRRPK